MKFIFIRSLAIALLATSISAFAASNDGKAAEKTNANDAKSGAPAASLTGVQENASPNKENNQCCSCSSCPSEQKIKEQDKQWLHDLQGIFG
jgi:hypothetical protein